MQTGFACCCENTKRYHLSETEAPGAYRKPLACPVDEHEARRREALLTRPRYDFNDPKRSSLRDNFGAIDYLKVPVLFRQGRFLLGQEHGK